MRAKWSKLNHLQLGKYAEYLAKMAFTGAGLDVYSAEVDGKGIDFVIRKSDHEYYDVQVKSVRKAQYVYMTKETFRPRKNLLLALVTYLLDVYDRLIRKALPDGYSHFFSFCHMCNNYVIMIACWFNRHKFSLSGNIAHVLWRFKVIFSGTAWNVADHYPLLAAFRIEISDDYLESVIHQIWQLTNFWKDGMIAIRRAWK